MNERIHILGGGAVGLPLAAYLAKAGRNAVVVRTRPSSPAGRISVTVRGGAETLTVPVETIPLSGLRRIEGTVVVAVKSYANHALAAELAGKSVEGPLIIMQNGLGVEDPFREARFPAIYRCVLYVTSQSGPSNVVTFRPIASSPIGVVQGCGSGLRECVETLATPEFPFHSGQNIEGEIWKKAAVNSVFNSICPLLDVDNGIFARDRDVAALAGQIVEECAALARGLGIDLPVPVVMEQIIKISRGSPGVAISTLQDIRAGRETEMASLNLEMTRLAAARVPPVPLPGIALLGNLILAKSRIHRKLAEKTHE